VASVRAPGRADLGARMSAPRRLLNPFSTRMGQVLTSVMSFQRVGRPVSSLATLPTGLRRLRIDCDPDLVEEGTHLGPEIGGRDVVVTQGDGQAEVGFILG
jgi:hypothetical protein